MIKKKNRASRPVITRPKNAATFSGVPGGLGEVYIRVDPIPWAVAAAWNFLAANRGSSPGDACVSKRPRKIVIAQIAATCT
jgi:hypothetical protein